jgi:hypothetical protein
MKIVLREEDDPLCLMKEIKGNVATGAINVIDLANIYSCAFIATDDVGKMYPDGKIEVLGRMDNSDVRGCNQMA